MEKIAIVDPRESWPGEFERIGARLRVALGEHAERIDHVGSTAVAGLAAKDVIDIQISVGSLSGHDFRSTLADLGFDHDPEARDNLVGWEPDSPALDKLFFWSSAGRPVHVHIRETGRLNQEYALLFRDYLRATPFVRDAYQAVKRELARRFPEDSASYYAIKDPYMDTVYAAAKLWRDATGWSPDDHGL